MTETRYAIIDTTQPYQPYLSVDFGYTEYVSKAMLWYNYESALKSCQINEQVVKVKITYEVTV